MKNAALPVILASIVVDDVCVIENIPNVSDVALALEIIQSMGGSVKRINKTTVEIDTKNLVCGTSPVELVSKLVTDERYMLTVFYGKDSVQEEREQLANLIADKYPELETYFLDGTQEIYPYIFVAE